MQIKFDVKILIFALIFFITNQLENYITLMIFAFLHELSHVIIGKILKFKPHTLEIKPIGFSIAFYYPINDYNKKIYRANLLELKKILIYLAGPMFNLIIAIILTFYSVKIEIIYINLIIFLFNLIPIYPLDGGRITKSLLYIFCGLKKSYIIMRRISYVFAIILLFIGSLIIIKFQNIGLLFTIIYVSYICFEASIALQNKILIHELIEKYR